MGHTSLELAAVTGPPFFSETAALKSWLASGKGLVASPLESLELRLRVLSDGEIRSLVLRWCAGGAGGASPLPLPSILPPPSLRPDISTIW